MNKQFWAPRGPLTPGVCVWACASVFSMASVSRAAMPVEQGERLPEVVVTAIHDHSFAQVVTDPKQPRQPIPASDAADYLKSIPGFSAIRSGGSNSDPVFRGQFGSRLPLLTNGSQLMGACPSRMDAPSSYISPETYDQLTLVKGPQTVLWGPGASAGVVRFDRLPPEFTEPGARGSASVLGASHGRNDQRVELELGNASMFARMSANRAHSQDYQDGAGRRVPSAYEKWNTDVALGWTPDAQTLLELSAGAGDGEARYGARGMDGTQFRRESWGLRFEKRQINSWLSKVEAQLYHHNADHVMDNFKLRTPPASGMMAGGMASNVRRITTGGRVAATVQPAAQWELTTGMDMYTSPHDKRTGTPLLPFQTKERVRDAKFSNWGWFAELGWQASVQTRWVGGLRLDQAKAQRYGAAQVDTRSSSAMPSGFLRWEHVAADGTTVYAGVGHVQRFPDYWELISPGNSAVGKGNAFVTLKPEKTTQLDVGAQWKSDKAQAWVSAYMGVVQDYILLNYPGMTSSVRNVDARTAGLELGGSYRLTPSWTGQATLAGTWSDNRTDHRPLPQIPPAELRLGLDYAQDAWTAGALWRLVPGQHRYSLDEGNIVGRDLGASSGFGTLAINASYRVNSHLKLLAGVDNLFDKDYAEHLNLAGNAGFGYPGFARLQEPGRTVWVRADFQF
ncbi:TonB-dependent copper receptor [Comamonas sp. CMM02]|uniref:TonB-dependent copper receptor n=1 Tax=Comamonas sp. CMM02 TaxID=2769307 RepID=UPI00177D4ABA|nr:TonB-dependent copper receptor [Comamonas sp. CMM02]MBD9401983.1 TonB-dependent copper receptor [Comamonas sp. CMM02]